MTLIRSNCPIIHCRKKAARPPSKFAGCGSFRRYKTAVSNCLCEGDNGIDFSSGRINSVSAKYEEYIVNETNDNMRGECGDNVGISIL